MIRAQAIIVMALLAAPAWAGELPKEGIRTNCEAIETSKKNNGPEWLKLYSTVGSAFNATDTDRGMEAGVRRGWNEVFRDKYAINHKTTVAKILCMQLTDSHVASYIGGRLGMLYLVRTAFPALGISPEIARKAIPPLENGKSVQAFFRDAEDDQHTCYAVDGYEQLLCLAIEGAIAIDERFERRKERTGETGTRTVPFYRSEMMLVTPYGSPQNPKFHECGPVTWGECSLRRRHPKHQVLSDGVIAVDATLISMNETKAKYQILVRKLPKPTKSRH